MPPFLMTNLYFCPIQPRMDEVDALQAEAQNAINNADSLKSLDDLRVAYLGKKGKITEQLKTMGQRSPEERKTLGAALNKTKQAITAAIETKQQALELEETNARLADETIDISLPVRQEPRGAIHPITQVIDEITAIFADFGFTVAEGPEIEDDFHNFTALNIPPEHLARQMHDSV